MPATGSSAPGDRQAQLSASVPSRSITPDRALQAQCECTQRFVEVIRCSDAVSEAVMSGSPLRADETPWQAARGGMGHG